MKQIADEIRSKQDAIEQLMVDAVFGGQPEQEKRQFVRGFLVLVMAAAEGDEGPRDDYLEAVIPGCKTAGMDFAYIVSAMVSVSMVLAASLSRESLPWTIAFLTDYTARLIAVWQRS